MTYPTRPFVVIGPNGRVLGDLPSPLLIQMGGGEAYEEGAGFWRLRDDSWDTPGTEYTRVRIAQLRECPGYDTMPHLTEYGTTFANGLCPQCDGWRAEDRAARLEAVQAEVRSQRERGVTLSIKRAVAKVDGTPMPDGPFD